MRTSVTAITRWVFMAIVLLLTTAQPVFADLSAQMDGLAIESLPERPLYGPLADSLTEPYYSGLAPIAVDDSGVGFTTDEDTPFTLGNVLANDSDPEGDPLTVLSYDASGVLGLLTGVHAPDGSLDTSFSSDGLLTTSFGGIDEAYAVAVQADGKIVAAGNAWNGSNYDFALARYNSDGSLDTTFSGDGLLTTSFGSSDDYAYAMALQADGKIVTAGNVYDGSNYDFALARYNPDGSLDTTFSDDGLLTTDFGSGSDDGAHAVALQADGKIVVAGYASNGSNDDFALTRYNPDGSLDTTFSNDGLLTTNFGSGNDGADAVALQADGKIITAGYAYTGDDFTDDFALARYNPDGSLDTTFSGDGLLTTAVSSSYDFANAVALQADGKIVAAGYADNFGFNFALARYNPDGSLDTTFNDDGWLTTVFGGSYDVAYAVALQADGKIVAAGVAYTDSDFNFALARYNPDGNLDTTFSDDGLLTTTFGSGNVGAYAVAVQADGKIVAAGYADTDNTNGFALARYMVSDTGSFTYTPNGQFEGLANGESATETFSYVVSDGDLTDSATVTLTINGLNDAPVLATIGNQSGDELTTISFTAAASNPEPSEVLTFSLDVGAPDGAFIDPVSGAFSWTPTEAQGPGLYPVTVRVTDNGSPILDDSETITITVKKVNTAPTAVDDSGVGFTTDEDTPFTLDDVLDNDSDPQGDPLTVLSYDASGVLGLLTWNPTMDGSLDITFSGDGLLTTTFGSGNEKAHAVAVQADGKIVTAGYAWNSDRDFALARYNPDGSLDTSFSSDGLLTTDFNSGDDGADAVAVQADGKIVTAGYAYNGSNNDFALARYNPNGSLDTTFSSDGLLTTAVGSSSEARAVAVQADGKIVAAGSAYNGIFNSVFALARYNPDGSLDTTFSGDGLLTTDFGSSSEARAMAVQADGKIVAAGSAYNNGIFNSVFALARYNPDGSLDTTFSGDGLLTTAVGSYDDIAYAVALQADGKIMVAGHAYNGSTYDFALARYNPDGSLDTTFSGDGLLTTAVGSSSAANAVAVQADGEIVAAGNAYDGSTADFALARYNPDGSLDTTFSSDGLLTTDFGSSDGAYAVALQADGKIVAAGYVFNDSNYDFALARYMLSDSGSFTYDPNSQFEGLANGETAVETFSYVVSDGTLTDSATVTLTINGLNDAPVLAAIGNQSGYKLTTISFTAAASDPDLSNTLSFSLDAGAPAGAVIDPVTGAFSWTPTEAQGPGTYPVTVRVTDNGSPTLDDFETITITIYNHRIWLPIITRH